MKGDEKIISEFEKCFYSKLKKNWTDSEYRVILPYYLDVKYDKSKFLFAVKQALVDFSDSTYPNLMLSQYYSYQGKFDKALKIIDSTDVSNDKGLEGQFDLMRGGLFYQMKKYGDAIYWYDKYFKICHDVQYYFFVAKCYLAIHQYKKAIVNYCNYLKSVPDNNDTIYELNLCWDALKSYKDAIMFLEDYIYNKNQSFNVSAWFALALNYMRDGQIDKAISAYKYSIALNPGNSASYFNLGNLYSQQHKYPEAIEMYKKTIEIEGERYLSVLYLAESQYAIDDWKPAYMNFQRCIELNKECDEAYYSLAEMNYSLFELKKALKFINKAIDINTKKNNYYSLKGHILLMMECDDEAEENMIESLKMCPSDVENVIDSAISFLNQRKPEIIVPYLRNLLKDNPQDARLSILLSICEFYLGNKQESYINLINACESSIQDSNLFNLLNKLYAEFFRDREVKKIFDDKL